HVNVPPGDRLHQLLEARALIASLRPADAPVAVDSRHALGCGSFGRSVLVRTYRATRWSLARFAFMQCVSVPTPRLSYHKQVFSVWTLALENTQECQTRVYEAEKGISV